MEDEIDDNILETYQILARVGRGSYGVVWKVKDKTSGDILAIKKLISVFQDSVDAQRTYREVMILNKLESHQNIISLKRILRAENNIDLYLVFEYIETDLNNLIRMENLSQNEIKYIIFQVLFSLDYLHSSGVIHRDLKPSNILIDSNLKIKIADFSLARTIQNERKDENKNLTGYVSAKWYGAPEILLGSTNYESKVDTWSVGCILGEMIKGKPLFSGTGTIEKIFELLGKPSKEDVLHSKIDGLNNYVSTLKGFKRKNFSLEFPNSCDQSRDLLEKLLSFNPEKRLSAQEALKHPFFDDIFLKYYQEVTHSHIKLDLDDDSRYQIEEYQNAIYSITGGKKLEPKTDNIVINSDENEKNMGDASIIKQVDLIELNKSELKQEHNSSQKHSHQRNKTSTGLLTSPKINTPQSQIKSPNIYSMLRQDNGVSSTLEEQKFSYLTIKDSYKQSKSRGINSISNSVYNNNFESPKLQFRELQKTSLIKSPFGNYFYSSGNPSGAKLINNQTSNVKK